MAAKTTNIPYTIVIQSEYFGAANEVLPLTICLCLKAVVHSQNIMNDERLEFMIYLAIEAGNLIMGFWDSDVRARFKDDNTIVTEADLKVSEFIQTEIPKKYPNDGLLNEEAAEKKEAPKEKPAEKKEAPKPAPDKK